MSTPFLPQWHLQAPGLNGEIRVTDELFPCARKLQRSGTAEQRRATIR
ncbi:hypothetical protein [Pseudomonas sp. KNUC1026]|nr:hypothetical protein [Pseudomonas sp. KNUC1026]UFH48420.1 hypothetical protein LN139_14975 [Pseudomonas sp. KNUC1026]